ncbi:MAG: coproporphyrinogen dehydrogenase HemZ, partial [Lachnospiraceae bacterium]|nr:coproporphyrinogen dehydrogenase HemZ [Lachnospiraceae bacterium]
MITILLNKDRYLYDVHSLVKAFYQSDEVRADAVADFEDMLYRLEIDDMPIKSIRETTAGETKITLYRFFEDDITIFIEFLEEEEAEASPKAAAEDGRESTTIVNESTNGSDASVTTPKNLLKQALYGLLCNETGRELPWGALTGIRPTKIATQMLTDGKDDNTIENYLKNVHLVSGEKARLSIEIAHREREVLSKRDYENGYSLYVGIPFCPTRCSYCSFAAYPLQQAGHPDASHHDRTEVLKTKYAAMTDKYLVCLEKELAATAKLMRGVRLDTVYIGGGTPTSLNVAQLTRLLKFLRATFDFSQVKEFTVEAGRPDSILDVIGKLLTLREYGVDRICVNPQTMHQRTLDAIGRAHTVEQTREALHLARDAGFDNINMDIILGLPGEGPEDVAYTMHEIAKLKPDDLTVHSLALKRGSRMQAEMAGAVVPVVSPASADDDSASLYCAGHSA